MSFRIKNNDNAARPRQASFLFRTGLGTRLFLWLLAYSVLLVGSFIVFQYHREKKFKADEFNAQLQLINRHILDDLADGHDIRQISRSQLHPFDELRISVIDTSGRVVYDNTLDTIPHISHLEREEIACALRHGSGYTVRRHSESTGKTYFYSATLGSDGYVVRSAVPYSVPLTELLRADFGFLWIMGSVALLMCALGYFFTRRLGQNIMRLNRFAERAERGERIYDTEPFSNDELGSISHHIVRLYASLQQAIADRDREHRAALHEQQEKERIKKQLTNNINHELKTPVAAIQVCVETLLTHRNITDERRDDFLRRCLANTDRLSRLLADVALITRMDDAPSSIVCTPIDLAGIIAEVADECAPVASARGMEIHNCAVGPFPMSGNASLMSSVFRNLIDNAVAYSGGSRVTIDARSATAAAVPHSSALVSPASSDKLRYNSSSEHSSIVRNIVVTVSDDGSGVPPEHLPHLFERFYRIDKGRSRTAGGTGLGLSIVKNAVLLHRGNISVANRPDGGLTFTIILPCEGY